MSDNFEAFYSVNKLLRELKTTFYCWIVNDHTYKIMDGNEMIFETVFPSQLHAFILGLIYGKNNTKANTPTTS